MFVMAHSLEPQILRMNADGRDPLGERVGLVDGSTGVAGATQSGVRCRREVVDAMRCATAPPAKAGTPYTDELRPAGRIPQDNVAKPRECLYQLPSLCFPASRLRARFFSPPREFVSVCATPFDFGRCR